jgi:hypothetical protein
VCRAGCSAAPQAMEMDREEIRIFTPVPPLLIRAPGGPKLIKNWALRNRANALTSVALAKVIAALSFFIHTLGAYNY